MLCHINFVSTVMMYSCDHVQIDPLVNKLNENRCIEVQWLCDSSSCFSDDIDKLRSELNKGSILIDCSCPGGVHSDMHKAVKSCTQLPSGDPDSNKWRIIQLNNVESDTQTSSWSKSSIDYVDVMNYSDLSNVAVGRVDDKVMEYLGSRTSSIHSENEVQDSINLKDHLLKETIRNQKEIKEQLASVATSGQVKRLAEDVAEQRVQFARQSKETCELLKEDLDTIITKEEALGKYYNLPLQCIYIINVNFLTATDVRKLNKEL